MTTQEVTITFLLHKATPPKVFSSDSSMAFSSVLSLADSIHRAVTVHKQAHKQVATAHEEFLVSLGQTVFLGTGAYHFRYKRPR